ncbi:MAG TPA: hypothetical protein VFE38_12845 [Edaphobacter sp.]|nr:hypothetical protein [Edaphobacter sp.]
MLKRFIGYVILLLCIGVPAFAQKPAIRISAWYWLNSAPKADWEGDFVTMKNLGFTDVLISWGLDTAGLVTRKEDTTQAIRWAQKAGMGAYLIVWQPEANSLPRTPEFVHVNAEGKPIDSMDVFNPKWRSTDWKHYLQQIAKNYGHEPAMAGYVFDDSFSGGEASYGPYEEKVFGAPLPRKPSDPRWAEWTKARQGWWEDWAKDTVKYIREIDPNRQHEIYLEDVAGRIMDQAHNANSGVDFARVARHFDAVGGYIMPRWTSAPDSNQKVLQLTKDSIEGVRKIIGPKQQIIFTFWSANAAEEFAPGPAVYPTAAQIQSICEEALKLGIRHLDMYGYRIGQYRATREEMARMMPAEPKPYVLTGQFPQKFMWDRPEIHTQLGAYLRSLNKK